MFNLQNFSFFKNTFYITFECYRNDQYSSLQLRLRSERCKAVSLFCKSDTQSHLFEYWKRVVEASYFWTEVIRW